MPHNRSTTPITPAILLRAYAAGLFPMAETADDDRLFWVEPEKRGVFPLDAIRVSGSLAKLVRADRFTVRVDRDFEAVIEGCATGGGADRPDTWINGRIRALFGALFRQGHVHTVEAYRDGQLAGGLYGLQIGGAFFGESMFHRARDASKVCLVHLAARLAAGGFSLLDAQFITPHLASLGAVEIAKRDYRQRLVQAVAAEAAFTPPGWRDPLPGELALAALRAAGTGERVRRGATAVSS